MRQLSCRLAAVSGALRTIAIGIAALVTFALPPPGLAQQTARLPKVGILSPGTRSAVACASGILGYNVGCFVDGLRAVGYIDGRNITLEYRFADGDYGRLPALAADLVASEPDVIFTFTTPGAEAAAKATTTIPIVVSPAGEVTMTNLARNFSRPTGNVTGMTLFPTGDGEKCLQLLKELRPRTSRVAVLFDPDNPGMRDYGHLKAAASRIGITLIRIEVRGVADLPKALAMVTASNVDAIFMPNDAALVGSAEVLKQVNELALTQRLPFAAASTRMARDGALIGFGADIPALSRRGAHYVQRILSGAKPTDLPVEHPTIFRLSVNLKTAKVLGLTIPQSVLLRADELIE
jgi:putative ABC transport system substrate-binding protein